LKLNENRQYKDQVGCYIAQAASYSTESTTIIYVKAPSLL